MNRLAKGAAAFAFAATSLMAAQTASAQQITLTSNDQQVVLSGELENVTDTAYELRTTLGLLRVPIDKVTCTGEACPKIKRTSEFAVSGSSELAGKFMPSILSAYAAELQSDIDNAASPAGSLYTVTDALDDDLARIEVTSSSSTNGISDLLQGITSVALTTRPVRRREAEAFSGSGLGDLRTSDQEHVVALDGLVLVVSQDNPIRSITQRDAALIFAGSYTNWSQLGGPDAPIKLYVREASSGTGEVFARLVMAPEGVPVAANSEVVLSDQDIGRLVANDPFGIGFTSFAGRGETRALAIQGSCGLVSQASDFNIKTEEYPLTRRLYAYTTNDKNPEHVDGFLNFAASDAAQEAIRTAGFVDQGITTSGVSRQGMRFASAIVSSGSIQQLLPLRQMVNEMLSSERFSTTFRFETGAAVLDTRALDDVERLAERLSELTTFKKSVTLMGFTDSVGDPQLNADLSLRRANQVLNALIAARPELAERINFRTFGYGEISPIACNETADGRRINRRVEVWFRDTASQ